MSNKQIEKLPVNKDAFMKILKDKGLSLRGLDRDDNFKWSEKTLRRGLNDGQMSIGLVNSLVEYLNIDAREFVQTKIENEIKKSSIMLNLNIYDVDIIIKDNKIQVDWKLKKDE